MPASSVFPHSSVLIGYDDVVVLLLFVIVLAGVFDSHMLHSVPLRIMLGIGLAGTFLLRRWFIYACLGLAVTAIIYWGCRIALTVANNRRDLFSTLVRAMLTIGTTTLVCRFRSPDSSGNPCSATNPSHTMHGRYSLRIKPNSSISVRPSDGYGWQSLLQGWLSLHS